MDSNTYKVRGTVTSLYTSVDKYYAVAFANKQLVDSITNVEDLIITQSSSSDIYVSDNTSNPIAQYDVVNVEWTPSNVFTDSGMTTVEAIDASKTGLYDFRILVVATNGEIFECWQLQQKNIQEYVR